MLLKTFCTKVQQSWYERACSGFSMGPRPFKIEGNERADLAAKEAACRGGKETDCWSSLAHVRTELKRTTLDELSTWHLLKTQEREDNRRGFYISRAKFGIVPTLGKTPKKVCITILPTKGWARSGRGVPSQN